jgi:hypothetical protein
MILELAANNLWQNMAFIGTSVRLWNSLPPSPVTSLKEANRSVQLSVTFGVT